MPNGSLFSYLLLLLGLSLLISGMEYLLLRYWDRRAAAFAGARMERLFVTAKNSEKKISRHKIILLTLVFSIISGSLMLGFDYLFNEVAQAGSGMPFVVLAQNALIFSFGWKYHAIWLGERGITGGGLPDLRWEQIERVSFDLDKGQTNWGFKVYRKGNNGKPIKAMMHRDNKPVLEEKLVLYLGKDAIS